MHTVLNGGHISLVGFLDDKRSQVVSGLCVVLGVAAVTVGELLGLPASAEHSLVGNVLQNSDEIGFVQAQQVNDSGLIPAIHTPNPNKAELLRKKTLQENKGKHF